MNALRRRSPAFLGVVVALPVALVTGLVVATILLTHSVPDTGGPVQVMPIPAPSATGPDCDRLLAAFPADLGGSYRPASIAPPAPSGVRAWRPSVGGDPLVVRCGLPRPAGFTVTSDVQIVDGVQWFASPAGLHAPVSAWWAVDRPVYVVLSTPPDTGPTPIQVVSDTLSRLLPARPLDPAPLPR